MRVDNFVGRTDLSQFEVAPHRPLAAIQELELLIVERLGDARSPYDGSPFDSLEESDIEHIVARSEADRQRAVRGQPGGAGAFRARGRT